MSSGKSKKREANKIRRRLERKQAKAARYAASMGTKKRNKNKKRDPNAYGTIWLKQMR